MLLSIVIPAFNEIATLGRTLAAVALSLPDVRKQVIIVDDASTDGTRDWLQRRFPGNGGRFTTYQLVEAGTGASPARSVTDNRPEIEVVVIFHERNRGKGGALQSGFAAVTGDVVVVQDADLEYDPTDWERMYPLIAERRVADVVFGSRFYGMPHRTLYFHHYLANRLVSFLFNLLFNQMLSDVEVCYKMMTREVMQTLRLTCCDFGVEIEMSAKIARGSHWRIYEVGISYFGRTYAEGKKIGWRDGLKALWYLCKFRAIPV
jgi:glycosyltransferase involved in cell wall biosynthesis